MPGVTDYSDDELGEPPPPPTLTRGVPHIAEPPSPPPLTRSSRVGLNGMRRGPSPAVEGDDWIRQFTENDNTLNNSIRNAESPQVPRELFSTRSSGSWSTASTEPYDWMDNVPWNLRSDPFWKRPNDLYPTSPDIDEIVNGIDKTIETKPFYLERYELPYPNLPDYDLVPTASTLNVALVEKYLNEFRTMKLKLKPDERDLFLIIVRNYLKYAPPDIITEMIEYFRVRGGKKTNKTKKPKKNKTRKYKTKRV
jgi:hypothetical protein